MPFKLVPKEQEPELRGKKDSFKIITELVNGVLVKHTPDNWTLGTAVVVVDVETKEIKAYWADGGYWSVIDETEMIIPYLFQRPKAAFRRMEKAKDHFWEMLLDDTRVEARLSAWWVGDYLELGKYKQFSRQVPGSPRQ